MALFRRRRVARKTTRRRTTRRKTTRRKTARRKTTKRRTTKRKTKRKVRRGAKAFGGYQIRPDENLAKIIGNKPVSPAQMTKKVWVYIKRRKLGSR
jgi:chromatin remodeling complex protein RSC6